VTAEAGAAGLSSARRVPRLLSFIVLCVVAECGAAPGSALGQYQMAPQYQAVPQYRPLPQYQLQPQYQPAPQYQPPLPVPQAPVYQPGPYDNYNHGNGP
jgi:hypothetical protein